MFAKDTPYGILSSSLIHISWFFLPLGERENESECSYFLFWEYHLNLSFQAENFSSHSPKKETNIKRTKRNNNNSNNGENNKWIFGLPDTLVTLLIAFCCRWTSRKVSFTLAKERARERECVNEWLNVRFLVPFHWKLKKLLTLFKYLMR